MVVTRSKIMVNYYGAELTRLCIVPMYLCNTQILNNNIDTFTNDILYNTLYCQKYWVTPLQWKVWLL